MLLCCTSCEKRQISVSEPKFGEVRGDARPGWWLAGKPMVDFLFAIIELFSLLRFQSYKVKCVQLSCFCYCFCFVMRLEILPGQGRPPPAILGIRKLALGYPMVKTASLCIMSFWHNTKVWRTDRWICHSIYSACKAMLCKRCRNCGLRLALVTMSLLISLASVVNDLPIANNNGDVHRIPGITP